MYIHRKLLPDVWPSSSISLFTCSGEWTNSQKPVLYTLTFCRVNIMGFGVWLSLWLYISLFMFSGEEALALATLLKCVCVCVCVCVCECVCVHVISGEEPRALATLLVIIIIYNNASMITIIYNDHYHYRFIIEWQISHSMMMIIYNDDLSRF